MLLTEAGAHRHMHSVAFDDVNHLMKREVTGQRKIDRQSSFGLDRTDLVNRVVHEDLLVGIIQNPASADKLCSGPKNRLVPMA
jgi:hypothetical protein